jgi:hypothetical protein
MLRVVAACGVLGSLMLAILALVQPIAAAPPPAPAPAATPVTLPAPMPALVDSFVAERDSLMKEVLEHIAGRENAPAESVFKNIKVLKGMPAGRLPRLMNLGFGRNLGVSCAHCHVAGHWADEDKAQKQITREMMALVDTINRVMLPRIKNLKSEHPTVTCATCHRGSRKPATSL